jgi:NAD(P)-dependent dehydrogenase (short-subunit alcohol dehydrogenase family)
MQTGLKGKTVLITEAAQNFGGETALAFAREGADLVLATGGGRESLEPTAQIAAEMGVKAGIYSWDVGDQAQVQATVRQILADSGRLDVLVNNASFPMSFSSLEEIPFDDWQLKLRREITGATYVFKEIIPVMIQQKWGRIVNYIGLSAFLGTTAPDSATGLGLVGLTRGIARDYGKHNITANCIGPGGVETSGEPGSPVFPPGEGDPLPRWGKPEEVAFLALCLASEDAGYVTGQCLLANGGKYFL